MDFTKSKILTSAAYSQRCKDILTQRLAHEAEAKRKAAFKEANRETRLREKDERQRGVREHAIAREAQRQERQRLELERRPTGWCGGRRHAGAASVEALPTTPLSPPTLPPNPFGAPQIWQPQHASLNPPGYFYNPLLLPHLFPGGTSSMSVNDNNVNGRIPWIGTGAWELSSRGTNQRIPRNFS